VLLKQGERALFVYGFAKSKLDNISGNDERYYKGFAQRFIAYSEAEIEAAVVAGEFIEI
jgi:hypothetical protein